MPTLQRVPRRVARLAFAAALAVAIAVTPAAAIFGGATSHPTPRLVAGPAQCTGGESMDAYSLACVPDIVPSSGAPSEMQLTDTNPGVASPSHGGR